ncbi:MAG TPA: PQQ-dependent sugar dehydrogenase [Thiolinea sp.]|nr:PQQ-dependent sugar dehydrogenase [Thiolinea sp.]
MKKSWLYLYLGFLSLVLAGCDAQSASPVTATKVVGGLDHPWSMAFLPENEVLITERGGSLRSVKKGKLSGPIVGVPKVFAQGQGGLLGIAAHPQFSENRLIYLAYSGAGKGGASTELVRAKYQQGKLSNLQKLFVALPKVDSAHHFGGRLLFDKQGYLYLTLGERGQQDLAQDISNHAGSVIRIKDDGSVPDSNPFKNTAGAKPEIYTYGHRNVQGIALNPTTGQVWTHEHGPQGGDEINILKPGANYGWPVITYGEEYGGGPIGAGKKQQEGMEQPLHYWVPSIAPSGMTFYTGNKYSGWNGSLLVGSLKFSKLVRLTLVGGKVAAEENLLEDEIGRIRDVQQGPDGYLYVLNDETDGGLYRLEPGQ